jgi:mRNA-degrading endonuclease toxin of MazEF toxin-antitoxin module
MQSGDVIWVRMVDPNGVNEKVRPVVVLTSSEEISAGSPVVGASITTTLPNPLTDDYVELPWHPQGRVRTGLRRRCAVLCTWLVRIDPAQIEETRGRVPGDKLREINTKISELAERARRQSEGDTPSSEV